VTTVLNWLFPALAGISVIFALFYIMRALGARRKSSRLTYGVARQEARQLMQANAVYSGALVVVGLILLGIWSVIPAPAEEVPVLTSTPAPTAVPVITEPTITPALILPTATAVIVPTTNATLVPAPTETAVPVVETPVTEIVAPTNTAVSGQPSATVSSGVGVWLRAGPSTEAEQLEWVLDGTILTLLSGQQTADGFEWQQVETPVGNQGWVAVPYIVYSNQ
jgi:hypothetical protein